MATDNFSAAPRPYAPPMAASGYGKRSAPGQRPRRKGDFAHLPVREAGIAAFIDRLPDGAAIDTKTLAKEQPLYGQQAVRSALNALSLAGHLRRVRENAGAGQTRWVYRTYFSRTARDDAWWAHFLATGLSDDGASADVTVSQPRDIHPEERPRPRPTPPPQHPNPPARQRQATAVLSRPARSDAYEALASLGRADARMTLSASECAELEGLAAEWLACGVTAAQFKATLTAGLPETVHSAGALTRKRLIAKMPPAPLRIAETTARRIMECTDCGAPGRPEALPGGLCRTCRPGVPSPEPSRPIRPSSTDVHSRVEQLRAAARRGRSRTP
ncbi:hypothetical protein [Kitasatospora sp. MAP5-34]|uniref:hypothetical protein n=1 Tax=Kitasatospora sp. MAP5-34 TaxID=3035102 RepID=UPI002474AF26|nr:hypothetical protein [Kitasatospora sp. MAP5-34]MDH6575726.1 hypothetical protein [Kitasatospora sp. MAP5-34]